MVCGSGLISAWVFYASAWIPWTKSVDLHPSVYDSSCLEAAKGAASWEPRWRTDDKINQASLQMIQCKPAKCSLFFSRKDTHLSRGYASVQDPPLSNVYEYVPTLATNTGSVPKIPTEVSQLNEKSTNEISLFIILLRLFLPNCLFCCAVKSCRSASTKEMACSSRVTAKMLCFRRWSRAAFITWGQGCRSLLN